MSVAPVYRAAGIPVKFLDIALIVANAVGIVLYLVLASRGWRVSQEHAMIPVAGEPFVWALALPVLGLFFVANLAWAGVLVRHRKSKRGLWWLLTLGIWLIAVCVDFAHH